MKKLKENKRLNRGRGRDKEIEVGLYARAITKKGRGGVGRGRRGESTRLDWLIQRPAVSGEVLKRLRHW